MKKYLWERKNKETGVGGGGGLAKIKNLDFGDPVDLALKSNLIFDSITRPEVSQSWAKTFLSATSAI